MQRLFQSRIEKKAQPEGGQLPSNTAEWPVKIRDEWSKIAPFAAGYPAEIVLAEKDDEQGYGFGHIIVTSKTSFQAPQAIGQLGAQFGVKTAKIPVLIEDFQLYPFDLLVTEEGSVLPLNESRLRQALFRPSTFDTPAKGPGNELFGATLYPPMREANLTKASAYPVLEGIADTITKDQVDRLARDVMRSTVTTKLASDPATWNYLRKVNSIPTDEPLTKAAALASIPADVVMIRRDTTDDDEPVYRVKTAMRQAYDPQEYALDRTAALQWLGQERIKEADLKGMVIIIRRKAGMSSPEVGGGEHSFSGGGSGPCKVLSAGGEPMLGHVLSRIKSLLSGGEMPMQLFSDGSSYGMGDSIGSSPLGEGEEAPGPEEGGEPSGTGVFCWGGEGGETCTEPVQVHGSTVENGRKAYLCETLAGQRVSLVPSEQAHDVAPGGEGLTLIPAGAKWRRLGDKVVKLANPEEANSLTEAKTAASRCTVRYGEQRFHFDGWPLRKMGNLRSLGPTDALFVCGLMGLSKTASEKLLAKAYRQGEVSVTGVPEIRPYDEVRKAAELETEKVAAEAENLTIPFLVKEATSLGDAQSIDAVLSLGFLNLDNVSRFVTYIPYLENGLKKLCVLLMAARLGLSELPQDHLSRAISALEQALGGLRRVALRLSPINSALS